MPFGLWWVQSPISAVIKHSHSEEGSSKVSSMIKQPPSHNEPRCIHGNDRFQGLKKKSNARGKTLPPHNPTDVYTHFELQRIDVLSAD